MAEYNTQLIHYVKYNIMAFGLNFIVTKWGKIGAGIFSTISLALGIASYFHDTGGTLSASLNGSTIDNNENKEFVVFIDNSRISQLSAIQPRFHNISSYSIRDFVLKYEVTCDGVQFSPTDFYKLHHNGNQYTLQYDEDYLSGMAYTENPISEIIVPENGGELQIEAKANYDGCKTPYSYAIRTRYIVIPNTEKLSFEQWKEKCLNSTSFARSSPVLYLTQSGHMAYEENVSLPTIQTKSVTSQVKPTTHVEQPAVSGSMSKQPLNPEEEEISSKEVKEIPAKGTKAPQNIYVKQYIDSLNNNLPTVEIGYIKRPDSILHICALTEDAQGIMSSTFLLIGKDENECYVAHRIPNAKFIDYAICTENPFLIDSVKIKERKVSDKIVCTIHNKTRRTIAAHDIHDYHAFLVAPHDNTEIITTEKSVSFRFFDVPNSALSEKYAELKLWPETRDLLEYAVIGFLITIATFIVIFISLVVFALIDKNYKELKENFRDIPSTLPYVLLYSLAISLLLVIVFTLETIFKYYDIHI